MHNQKLTSARLRAISARVLATVAIVVAVIAVSSFLTAGRPAQGLLNTRISASPEGKLLRSAQASSTASVDIGDNLFSPKTITVSAGTVVTWTNRGNIGHTVSADNCSPLQFNSDSQFSAGLRPGNQYSLTVPADAKAGTVIYYHCEFHGAAGTCTSPGPGMTGSITVGEPTPDFTLSVNPGSQSIMAGNSSSFTINLQATGNFAQPVNLNATVNPSSSSVTASASPNTITPSGNATLTVNTTADAAPNTYTITVTGTAGQIVHTATASLRVTSGQGQGDFGLSFNPAMLTVDRGKSGQITVNIDRTGGFDGKVTVAAPDPGTLKSFKIKVTPPSQATTGANLNFNFKVKKKAATGTRQLIFTGQDDSGRAHTGTFTLVIQ